MWKFRATTSYWCCYSGSCLCEFFSIIFLKIFINSILIVTILEFDKMKAALPVIQSKIENPYPNVDKNNCHIYLSTTTMTKPTTKSTSSNNDIETNANLSSMQVCYFIISSINMWMKQLPSISLFSKYMYRYPQNYYMYLYICMYNMHGHFSIIHNVYWLIDWMVFNTAFNIISIISW